MSKKSKYKFRERPAVSTSNLSSSSSVTTASSSAMSAHVAEYKIISKDLIRLVIVNGVMLAAVLVVYFTNRSSGYLEKMFQNLF